MARRTNCELSNTHVGKLALSELCSFYHNSASIAQRIAVVEAADVSPIYLQSNNAEFTACPGTGAERAFCIQLRGQTEESPRCRLKHNRTWEGCIGRASLVLMQLLTCEPAEASSESSSTNLSLLCSTSRQSCPRLAFLRHILQLQKLMWKNVDAQQLAFACRSPHGQVRE